jgi:hypothetical protein
MLAMECEELKCYVRNVELTLAIYLMMALIPQERGFASILFHWSLIRPKEEEKKKNMSHKEVNEQGEGSNNKKVL